MPASEPASEPARRLLVLNHRNRPVEIHIGRRVVRIAPLATAAVPLAGERDSAQLHELVRQRVVTILGEEPAKPTKAAKAAKAKKVAKKRADGRSRRPTR